MRTHTTLPEEQARGVQTCPLACQVLVALTALSSSSARVSINSHLTDVDHIELGARPLDEPVCEAGGDATAAVGVEARQVFGGVVEVLDEGEADGVGRAPVLPERDIEAEPMCTMPCGTNAVEGHPASPAPRSKTPRNRMDDDRTSVRVSGGSTASSSSNAISGGKVQYSKTQASGRTTLTSSEP